MGKLITAVNSITGARFVETTTLSLEQKKCEHVNFAFSGDSSKLHTAIRKYGPAKFKWEVIADNIAEDRLNVEEMLAIKKYKTFYANQYNELPGGQHDWNEEKQEHGWLTEACLVFGEILNDKPSPENPNLTVHYKTRDKEFRNFSGQNKQLKKGRDDSQGITLVDYLTNKYAEETNDEIEILEGSVL